MSKQIKAVYTGKCKACACTIHTGDACYFAKGFGVRCIACGPHNGTEAPSKTAPSRPGARGRARRAPSPAIPSVKREVNVDWKALGFTPVNERPGFTPESALLTADADGIMRAEYDSIREMVEYSVADFAQGDNNRSILNQCYSEHTSSWMNGYNREKLVRELSHPNEKLLKAVEEMKEAIERDLALPPVRARKLRRGQDFGEDMCVDKWLQRDPSAWDRWQREEKPNHTVTIMCNGSVHAGQRPEELLYRGAAAVALADALSLKGLNVGICMMLSSEGSSSKSGRLSQKVWVKRPENPLDMSALCLSLCEIAFVRVIGLYAYLRRIPGTVNYGFGQPKGIPEADKKQADFVIDNDITTKQEAIAWVKAQLSKKEQEENG